jgi:N-hydroxyarylamine O-acetyltransferase
MPSQLPVGLVDAVLLRLGLGSAPTIDLAGLSRLYARWCQRVPFDNVLKLLHLREAWPGPLPGSNAADFFRLWLEYGTGGTCWAGNGALHDLVCALGFSSQRGIATMMPTPEPRAPNHGTVVVNLDDGRFVVDASILSNVPLALDQMQGDGPLPRLTRLAGATAILWRSPAAPEGFPCRIERIGVDDDEWDARHQRTAAWSPFNFSVRARLNRGDDIVGYTDGARYAFRGGESLATRSVDRAGRDAFLAEIGFDPDLVSRLPEDAATPPAPDDFHRSS